MRVTAISVRILFALLMLCLLIASQGQAATPPGTLIRSQAQAYFKDEYQQSYVVTSNEVVTLIQEVTGVRLDSPQKRWGMNGIAIVFPHLLTNSGNTSARYTLTLKTQRLPDNPSTYGIEQPSLYFDKEHDGLPKDKNKITGPIALAPGEHVSLLIKAGVPDEDHNEIALFARVSGTECKDVPEATASTQGRCLAVNRNQVSRSKGVVYEVSMSTDDTKTDEETGGEYVYIDENFTTKLSFIRKEDRTYTSYVAMDYLLPEELEYVKGTSQLCRYDGTECREFKDPTSIENGLRFYVEEDTDQVGTPKFRHDGQIHFEVKARGGVGKTIYNAAEYTFRPIGQPIHGGVRQTTNYVPLEIKGYGVSLNASSLSSDAHIGEPQIVASAPAGGIVEFTNYLWNLGTEDTGYAVTLETRNNTFPGGSLYCLTKDENCTTKYTNQPPVLTFAPREISPGSHKPIRLFVQLPEATKFTPQQNYSLTLKAEDTSTAHSYEVTDTTRNMLIKILGSSSSSMDLTLGAPPDKGGSGAGKGPEAAPLETLSGNPGTTLIFDDIFINNTGDQTDHYLLNVLSAKGVTLPDGIRWSFINEFNQPTSSSGTMAAGNSKKLGLVVELPDNLLPGQWSFYVKASSPVNTKVSDQLHLALMVDDQYLVTLVPNGRIQVSPGSFVTFTHQLSNLGNTTVDSIALQLEDSRAAEGWQSLVYQDANNDGQIDGGDSLIQEAISLDAKTTMQLLVKVFAPTNASQGSENITTLTATFGDGNSVSVTDSATANNAIVTITKAQAKWDCNSTVPTSFSSNTFPVKPSECVVYRLTATNQGSELVHNVVIYDKAPDFTRFHNQNGLPEASSGGATDVSDQTINVLWNKGLMPGQSVFLKFGIQVQ